jgi:hypothetical protein
VKRMILCVFLALVFCFLGIEGILFSQTSSGVNAFIGKWKGVWSNIRGSRSVQNETQAELLVKENGKIEYQYGTDPNKEYEYTIIGDVLTFKSNSGKIFEFRFTSEGNLKATVLNDVNHQGVFSR